MGPPNIIVYQPASQLQNPVQGPMILSGTLMATSINFEVLKLQGFRAFYLIYL